MGAVLDPLVCGSAGVDDVLGFLARVRPFVATPDSAGCFMVNTTTELSPRDPEIAERTRRYQERIRDSLRSALVRAAALHEIDAVTTDDRAHLVQASLYGTFVAARGGASSEALAGLDALEREVERWRDRTPAGPR